MMRKVYKTWDEFVADCKRHRLFADSHFDGTYNAKGDLIGTFRPDPDDVNGSVVYKDLKDQ